MIKRNVLRLLAALLIVVASAAYIDPPRAVLALGTPQIVSIDPPSPAPVGTCIKVRVKVPWDSEFRSMRVRFGNDGWQEEATTEFERTFCTSNYSPGTYTIRVEAARHGDNNWSSPTSAEARYELRAASQPTTPPNNLSCNIQSFSVSPTSGQAGSSFGLSGSGSCSSGVRAIRFRVDGNIVYEFGGPSASTTWNSSGSWRGWHTATFEVAGLGDNDWRYAASQTVNFEVSGGGGSGNPPPQTPSQPQPTTPQGWWYGNQGTLNLSGYCQSKGFADAVLVSNDVYGWRCRSISINLSGMDLYDLCRWQYGSGTPEFTNKNDPSSWKCNGVSTTSPPSGSQSNNNGGSGGNSGSSGSTYTVVSGDTLGKIARKCNTTISSLIQFNKGTYPSLATNPDFIKTGWQLFGCNSNVSSAGPAQPSQVEEKWCSSGLDARDLGGGTLTDKNYVVELGGSRDLLVDPINKVRIFYNGTRENWAYHGYFDERGGVYRWGVSTKWAYLNRGWQTDSRWRIEYQCQ